MDKIKFLMSDTGAEITAACREALEQKGVEVTVVEKDGLKVLQKMLAVRPQVDRKSTRLNSSHVR